ncbi:MAG: hypothetical protein KDA85_01125 [Planctomycetaceae bacterium]|nr:hypothetical protein [Planctomycetaceae bacterium]
MPRLDRKRDASTGQHAATRLILITVITAFVGCDAIQKAADSAGGGSDAEVAAPDIPPPADPSGSPTIGAEPAQAPTMNGPVAPAPSPEQQLTEILNRQLNTLSDNDVRTLIDLKTVNATILQLDLRGSQLTAETVAGLATLPGLRQLDLSGTGWSPDAWAALGQVTQLESLDLTNCPIDDQTAAFLRSLTGLKRLSLAGTRITDQAFHHLTSLGQLEEFDVGSTQITGAGFEALGAKGAHAPLRKIVVIRTGFGQFGPLHLHNFRDLEELGAAGCGLTDDGVQLVKNCDHLQRLYISGNSLTDKGLRFLSGMKELETLDVSGMIYVSNATLERIKDLKTLRDVNISGSGCNQQGIQALKGFLPECRILMDGGTY